MNCIDQLQKIVSNDRILVSDKDKAYACKDASTNCVESMPMIVVIVDTSEELILVVKACIENRVPIVVRGAGTGKSGGAIAGENSVVIDTTKLNRILSIDPANMLAVVEPGVILHDLQCRARRENLYYPVDPASFRESTIGGNVAENAAGPSTLKYGTTRDYLLGGQAIIGTGEIIDFGKSCPKGVTGYDVAALLSGSEGTLAIFTKFILRLLPAPRSEAAAIYFFTDEEEAILVVNNLLRYYRPRTLEYVDARSLQALQKEADIAFPDDTRAALIVECDAYHEHGADHDLAEITSFLSQSTSKIIARDQKAREYIWWLRSRLSEACTKFLSKKISEDIALPLGMLAQFRREVKQFEKSSAINIALFGHAGDGNLHVQIMFSDDKYLSEVMRIRHDILLLVLRLGGTLSAEHGIGLQKKSYLPLEQKPEMIALQKRIKEAFDPHNLFNPGKIFES